MGDDEGRLAVGLWIASTRVEKWNVTVVAEQCKHRSMNWTVNRVLAMVLHAVQVKRSAQNDAKKNTETHTCL